MSAPAACPVPRCGGWLVPDDTGYTGDPDGVL